MADTDLLPSRGVTFEALVDSTGVAINGSSTVAQLAAKGFRAACAVDGTGTAITGGANLVQIAAAGIRAFCAVDQNGVAQDASTADQLRARGIRPRVLLDATGVALNGSAGQAVLASRGLQSFCPVDESGNATTMGAVILISNTNVFDNIAVGATVGTLSVAGGSGTYTFTLPSNPGAHFATAGTNGVNLNTATALTAGSYPVTVQAAGGVPTPISRALSITVSQAPTLPANTVLPVISGLTQVGLTLTTTDGTWTGFPTPGFTYQWKRGGSAISGATANSYLLVSADLGANITVTVTATNTAGNTSATSAAVGPITALANNYVLTAQSGAFAFNGVDMTVQTATTMAAGSAGFAFTGIAVTLTYTSTATYHGPMDVAGYTAPYGCWSLRAATAAIAAAATQNLIDIVDSANANLLTLKCLATGDLDLSAVPAWITAHGTAYISKFYDQSGHGRDLIPGFSSGIWAYPQLVLNALGTKAALFFDPTWGGGTGSTLLSSALPANTPQPLTTSYILNPVGTSGGRIFSNGTSGLQFGYDGGGTNDILFAGTVQAFTPIAGWQAAQFVINDPAASTVNLANAGNNPTGTTTTLGGSAGSAGLVSSNHFAIGTRNEPTGDLSYNGYIFEFILLTSAVSPTNQAAQAANQRLYGGF